MPPYRTIPSNEEPNSERFMKPQRIRQRDCYPSRNGWQNPPVFLPRVVKQSETGLEKLLVISSKGQRMGWSRESTINLN
jgi:hypothetical protein